MNDTIKYFKENGVACKKVEDDREDYDDFIAIFSYGNLTREQIMKPIREKDLAMIFFESAIREDEYKKQQLKLRRASDE